MDRRALELRNSGTRCETGSLLLFIGPIKKTALLFEETGPAADASTALDIVLRPIILVCCLPSSAPPSPTISVAAGPESTSLNAV